MAEIQKENQVVNLPGISLGMILQIQVEGLGTARSRLVGIDHGAFLIVKTPPIVDIATQLYEKNHIVIRYFSSGWVYAFRCTLLSLIKEPARLSILSYPEYLEKINVRKYERVDCNIPAEALIQGKKSRCTLKNISSGGMGMVIDKDSEKDLPQLGINDVISVTLLRKEDDEASFRMIVRNIKVDRSEMFIGMEFFSPGPDRKENRAIDNWLGDIISESL